MRSDNSNGSRAAPARGVMALLVVLAMGLGLLASPAAAAPFAYVANSDETVSVIDTATTPRPWWPRSRRSWGDCVAFPSEVESPSLQMGNTPMSRAIEFW
jgi:hypothetical protein